MISAFLRPRSIILTGSMLMLSLALSAPLSAQDKSEPHFRKHKPLPPAARITVTVQTAESGKPLENAAVIFRASHGGKNEGYLEVKSNTDGEAKIDVIEVGSHVTVQVIANGYATNAVEFDVPTEEKSLLVKMQKPRAQVSTYQDNDGKASQRPAGIQEPPPLLPTKKPAPSTPR